MKERKTPCTAAVTPACQNGLPDLNLSHDPLQEPSPNRRSRTLKRLSDERLIKMLNSSDGGKVYATLEEMGRRRVKAALPALKYVSLYEEDKGIQDAAVTTIRRIGGRSALDILRFLMVTEHREHIEELLKMRRSEIDKWYEELGNR